MKIENQVCSLELAKKLKELGVKQKSLFWWEYWPHTDGYALSYAPAGLSKLNISAFTVAELGEILPARTGSYRKTGYRNGSGKGIYSCVDYSIKVRVQHGNTEADARAAMLIYLIENGIIKPDEL